ncbi:MAG: ribosome maturation factor RimM [Coriobacteriia bacterium]|nr:ribosome maturation factor RimM [Coriobacteriia bacterium]
MDGSPFTAVARVVKTHGLDGEVALSLMFDADPRELLVGRELWPVPPRGVPRPLHACDIRVPSTGDEVVVRFAETQDLATSKRLVGTLLLARAGDLPELPAGPPDARGFAVVDEQRGLLGTIEDVIVTGANDVWVVRGTRGEVLVPVIEDVVMDLDEASRTAIVRLLPGLLDED